MIPENKQGLSVSMLYANVVAVFIMIPVAIRQRSLFYMLQDTKNMQFNLDLLNLLFFLALLIASMFVHELIHGLTWMWFGEKSSPMIKLGIQWKTLTPYAPLKEPIEINAYRIGGFMPGFILGILPFLLSLVLGNDNLLWVSVIPTAAASGDWLILWVLRHVKNGTMVEDHISRSGCYIYTS